MKIRIRKEISFSGRAEYFVLVPSVTFACDNLPKAIARKRWIIVPECGMVMCLRAARLVLKCVNGIVRLAGILARRRGRLGFVNENIGKYEG